MFVCEPCTNKYEGNAIEYAKILGLRSYGPCEICHKASNCYDIPSSADWKLKGQKINSGKNTKGG